MITVYKILNSGLDDSIMSMLPINSSGLRGDGTKLAIEYSQKDIRRCNFSMRVRKLWNSLPDAVANSKDVWAFEKKLDDFWQDQEFLYNDPKAKIKMGALSYDYP